MDAIMGTADVLEIEAGEPASEAPDAWRDVADPLAAPAALAEDPAPPPDPAAEAPGTSSEPAAAEADSGWGAEAESSWDSSPPPAEEPMCGISTSTSSTMIPISMFFECFRSV